MKNDCIVGMQNQGLRTSNRLLTDTIEQCTTIIAERLILLLSGNRWARYK